MELSNVVTEKFCIFCGKPPEQKNKEHVLPQWLIKMTGDPKRTVEFGAHPITGKIPKFDWSSFTFPACTTCNERYSKMEATVKPLVEALLNRDAISSADYLLLLDWLDKVRIGLWLGYSYLHKNPAQIRPAFHIDTRMGTKDRMVAVYTFETKNVGLNIYGSETLCFQFQPSCFLLRINSIALLSLSSDFLCGPRCGFPYPRTAVSDPVTGVQELGNYTISRKIKHPLMRHKIIKPSIHLFQPMLACPQSIKNENADWLGPMLIGGDENRGVIFRQLDDRVDVLSALEVKVENGKVAGRDSLPLKDIIAQTYALQISLFAPEGAPWNPRDVNGVRKMLYKILKADNTRYVNAFSGITIPNGKR